MKKHQSKLSAFNYIKYIFYTIIVGIFCAYFIFLLVSSLRSGKDDVNLSGIEITINSESYVFVDGVKVGTAQPDTSFFYGKIQPGRHLITITKISDASMKYERDLVFEKGTRVTVEWNFGVTLDTSHGIVKYFIKKSEDKNKIRIINGTVGATILIDKIAVTDAVIIADGIEHTIEISKTGYLSKSLVLSLINNSVTDNNISQSEKGKYNEFDLVVEVSLFQIPFE